MKSNIPRLGHSFRLLLFPPLRENEPNAPKRSVAPTTKQLVTPAKDEETQTRLHSKRLQIPTRAPRGGDECFPGIVWNQESLQTMSSSVTAICLNQMSHRWNPTQDEDVSFSTFQTPNPATWAGSTILISPRNVPGTSGYLDVVQPSRKCCF